jgi:acetyl esterase/lipase
MKKLKKKISFLLLESGLLGLAACATMATKVTDFTIQKKIVYKTVDGESLAGDLYLPTSAGPKPVALVVHGGSWSSTAGRMLQICEDLARSGYVVFNIDYRLAPEHLYPKAIEDVRDAAAFLQTHAAQYEIDPKRMIGWGYSAGSQLILMVGLDPQNHFAALVGGGTPAQFSSWPFSPIITRFIGKTYAEAPAVWDEASPVNHVQKNSPPVFLYHGENDHLVEVDQMYKMRDALQKQGVPVETHEVPFLGHIAVYLFSEKSIVLGIDFANRMLQRAQALTNSSTN